jgi:competence protein CoiA
MQFYALNHKGQIINAKQAQKHCDYICTECGTLLRIRSGEHRQTHFYHLESIRTCSLRKKGMVHLQLQNYLFNLLPVNDCHLEHRFSEIKRIADVVWISKKIVFEIQCSPISSLEISQRNLDYKSLGWSVVWILHDKRFNKEVLSTAERGLHDTLYYFSNMNAFGEGVIYDQFEIVEKNRRIRRLGALKVNLDDIKYLIEPINKNTLSLCRQKHLTWPFYFGGDLLDVKDLDYLQAAIRIEKEHQRMAVKQLLVGWMHRIIIRPYRVLFRYFLEKACR